MLTKITPWDVFMEARYNPVSPYLRMFSAECFKVWCMLWYSKDSTTFLFVPYMCATASASERNFIVIIIDILNAANQLLVS